MHEIDDTDRRILRAMQEDGSLTTAEVAERAGLSTSPCWRRIERMERDGVILGRAVEIDWSKLGYEVTVFLRVTLDKTNRNAFDEFVAAARKVPEVQRIHSLLGRVDVRMDVLARDLVHYQQVYRDRILGLPHIADIESLLLVSERKNTDRLPV